MASNPLFTSIHKSSARNCNGQVHCDGSKKIVAQLSPRCMISQKRNTMAEGEGGEPPEKRRKTDPLEMEAADDLWDDDDDGDFILSQMQLENIGASPLPTAGKTVARKEPNNNGAKTGPVSENVNSIQSTKSQGYHTMPQPSYGSGFNSGKHESQAAVKPSTSGTLYPGKNSSALSNNKVSGPLIKPGVDTGRQSISLGTKASSYQPKNSTVAPISNKKLVPGNKHGLDFGKQSPTAGTTASSGFGDSLNRRINQKEEENSFLKQENQKLKDCQYGKDGQIKLLRTKVAQLEAERSREKHDKMIQREQQNKEQTEKEKRLERELEKLKSTLQFKDREMTEVQDRCRRLERQGRSNSVETSPSRSGPISPCRAPYPSPSSRAKISLQSPKSGKMEAPTTPGRTGNDFPTRKSFLEAGGSPKKKKNELDSGVKQEKGETSTATRASVKPKKKPRMRLSVEREKGNLSGPQLVSRLLDSDCQSSANSTPGIIGLFHNRVPSVDVSGVKMERDRHTMNLSPVSTYRPTRHSTDSEISTNSDGHNKYAVKPEKLTSAQQAINALLNSNGYTTAQPTTGDPSVKINSCSSKYAILILPMIENYLQIYIDIMQGLNDSVATTVNSQSTERSSSMESSSVDSLATTLRSVMLKGASYFNTVECQTLSALSVLDKLISYCGCVRLVLAADKEEFDVPKEAVRMENVNVPDRPTQSNHIKKKDCMGGCSRMNNNSPLGGSVLLDLDSATLKTAKNCDILMKLIKLANPLEFNDKLGNLNICQAALRLLRSIATHCSLQQLKKFSVMFGQETLMNCLKHLDLRVDQQISLATCTLGLLTTLVKSTDVLQQLCLQDDECLLQPLYHTCEVIAGKAHQSQRMALSQQLFELVSVILTTHKTGAALLFEADCLCSSQVMKCITATVYRELETYEETKSPQVLAFLRKGLCLLHAVSTNDRLFTRHHERECKHQFIQTVCCLDKLLKVLPDVDEAELLQVYYLWDFDQEVDTDEDLNMDGSSPVNSQTQHAEVMIIDDD